MSHFGRVHLRRNGPIPPYAPLSLTAYPCTQETASPRGGGECASGTLTGHMRTHTGSEAQSVGARKCAKKVPTKGAGKGAGKDAKKSAGKGVKKVRGAESV